MINLLSQIYRNGERTISKVTVFTPKHEVPILADKKNIIETNKIDMKMNIQDGGSNIFRMFQVGGTFAGNLEYQYSGR